TGVPLREIDHVLLAARFGGAGPDSPPAMTLVVRTVLDHDQAKVRKTMKAKEAVTGAGADGVERAVREATLGPVPARLFQPDAKRVVVGLFDPEMKRVRGKPHGGAKRLRRELRDALEKRLPGARGLWAVGRSADWGKTRVPALIEPMRAAGPLIDQLPRL